MMDIRELSDKIAMDLVDAGMPTFPSNRHGFVDKNKVALLIRQSINEYMLKQKRIMDSKLLPKHPL